MARRAAAGDLWCVMVTMLPGEAAWLRCLWGAGEEEGVRWGRREKLRVRPEDDEPWRGEGGGGWAWGEERSGGGGGRGGRNMSDNWTGSCGSARLEKKTPDRR